MKYPEHTSTQFDVELGAVCASVLRMGAAVENQFRLALDTLSTGDLTVVDRVLDEGRTVNAMEVEIDERCTNILVRRQPTANDLRLVSTIIKTINDLERIGDEAESIARLAGLIASKQPARLPRLQQIKYIAEIALGMLMAALKSFDEMDSEAARKVGRKDTLIDEEFRSILRHLVAYMMEDTSELTTTLQVVFVVKAIGRIGDHAKNISEYVIYMMEGRDVRNCSTI
ncbi:MAG: phosphate signaling complex protein PhoU [Gallionellaceae bacterium]|nr:MAG: phosphate signaling complex protein PhoU [Gallionellaceae bacterium]